MKFCEKVKYVRGKLLLTQSQLALKLNVSFATVNRWEQGKIEPKFLKQKIFDSFCETNDVSFENEAL